MFAHAPQFECKKHGIAFIHVIAALLKRQRTGNAQGDAFSGYLLRRTFLAERKTADSHAKVKSFAFPR
ncbi:hypothetical protein [Paracandidimonas lactea]|jgi:hypothetical protein|uniref:hypothetical protein n=1 Tax=Paracandidimonas lactea TaxID=2895524 RepID=UPI001369D68E|nr:hypothetical protein [Paracandidimonas lactea]